MKIYGPFHALNNPLVMANLALEAVNQGAELYNTIEKGNDASFVNRALLSGQPVTSEPGGPIRRGLSKLTGGLVSPDVTASPEIVNEELSALQAQRKAGMDELKSRATIWNITGKDPLAGAGVPSSSPGPYSVMGGSLTPTGERLPVSPTGPASAAPSGGGGGLFTGVPPAMRREQRMERSAAEAARTHTTQYAEEMGAARKRGELSEVNKPANVAAALGLARAKGAATKAGAEGVALSPGVIEGEAAKAEAMSAARTRGTDAQKAADEANRPIGDLRTAKTGGGAYVNTSTLKIATGAKGEPATVGEAQNNPNYQFVPAKDLDIFKQTAAQIRRFNEMIANLDSGKYDQYFPDTSGMNTASALQARLNYGTYNYLHRGSDPALVPLYNSYADTVSFYHNLQKRYPSIRELQVPLVPDPGGLIPTGMAGTMTHLAGLNPGRLADSKEVARARWMDLRKRLLDDFTTGADISPLHETSSDELPSLDDVEPKSVEAKP